MLSGSAASVAAALLVLVLPVPVPPEPLLLLLLRPLHLLPSRLPQGVVESEAPLLLQDRQWFSAAMARSFPPPEKPTYERAPSTR